MARQARFFLPLPSEIPHSALSPVPYPPFCQTHPRHFYHPHVATLPDQLSHRQLRGNQSERLAATGQPIGTPGSYGAANQNAWQLRGSQSERSI